MEQWKEYKLSDILSIVSGFAYKGEYLGKGESLLLGMGCVSYSELFLEKGMRPYAGEFPERYSVEAGDIVLATRQQSDNLPILGMPAIVPQKFKGKKMVFGANLYKVVPKSPEFPIDYIYWLLKTPAYIRHIRSCQTGTTVRMITKANIEDYAFMCPCKEQRNQISKLLWDIEMKIELNRRINDNLEQQAQALFKSWFVDFEPFKGSEFVDSELGSTPKELPIIYIEDIPHNIESGKRPKGGATLEGIPSIGAENIKGLGYYDYSKTKYIPEEYAKAIRKGKINGYELLIYKDGGKPGYFIPNFTIFGEGFPFSEMYINEHVFILDLMDNGYNAFAYFYMRTPYIMNQLNSIGGKAAIPGINTKDVECLPIYAKESPYVKKFGEIVLPYIKTILSNSLENAKLAKVRDALLPKLMSGELTINKI